jgi:transposase
MPHPYSEDLRLRVVNAVESGQTTREVSALYQVSPSFVANVHQLWRETSAAFRTNRSVVIGAPCWNLTKPR